MNCLLALIHKCQLYHFFLKQIKYPFFVPWIWNKSLITYSCQKQSCSCSYCIWCIIGMSSGVLCLNCGIWKNGVGGAWREKWFPHALSTAWGQPLPPSAQFCHPDCSSLCANVYRDDGKPDTSYLNLLRLSPCVSIKSLCTLLIIHSRNLKSEMAISVRLRVFTSCIMKRLFWNLRCCLIYLFINKGGRGRSC